MKKVCTHVVHVKSNNTWSEVDEGVFDQIKAGIKIKSRGGLLVGG